VGCLLELVAIWLRQECSKWRSLPCLERLCLECPNGLNSPLMMADMVALPMVTLQSV